MTNKEIRHFGHKWIAIIIFTIATLTVVAGYILLSNIHFEFETIQHACMTFFIGSCMSLIAI
ncbi:MAG: hypothetical protein K2N28_02805 [Muribaculaceae bacterium]|nr:hypothetical protein [Muribaculaceae bacterium]